MSGRNGRCEVSVFDYIRERMTRIADETLAIDGAYPIWSYADLTMLLDSLEKEWKKKHPDEYIPMEYFENGGV